jgi:hypothetical protein
VVILIECVKIKIKTYLYATFPVVNVLTTCLGNERDVRKYQKQQKLISIPCFGVP